MERSLLEVAKNHDNAVPRLCLQAAELVISTNSKVTVTVKGEHVRDTCSAPLQSGTTQLDNSKLQNHQAFPNPQSQLPVLAALHRTDGEETTFSNFLF